MRVMADGRVKLEVDEVRVGDFFVKRERLHLKITDLNGVFTFRADARSAAGAWLNKMWERALMNDASAKATLHTYAATMWSFHSVVPDDQYMMGALKVTQEAIDRHPEWYGKRKKEGE